MCELRQHLIGVGQVRPHVPQVHIGVDVTQTGRVAAHPGLALGELSLDPADMRAKLIAHLRDRGRHRRGIELGATQLLAVCDEILRDFIGQ